MAVIERTAEEQSILAAGAAILDLMGRERLEDYNPTDLVLQLAQNHDRYSTRAALLHLLETGALALTSTWQVKLVDVGS